MLIMRPQKQTMNYPNADGAQDDCGKKRQSFAPPISSPVYAWAPPTPDFELPDFDTRLMQDYDCSSHDPSSPPGDTVLITGLEHTLIRSP